MYKARIVIGCGDESLRKFLKAALTKAGYIVMSEDSDGLKTLKAIQRLAPDLVILEGQLTNISGYQIAKNLAESDQAPVILISSYGETNSIERAAECRVFAHLIKPVEETNLCAAVEVALANYQRVLDLKKEIKRFEKAAQSRKLVEKAKGLLMEHQGLTEMEAYNKLRKESMNKHISMGKLAEHVIAFYELMQKK